MQVKNMMASLCLFMILSASSLCATNALVDDFSSGTNENYLENYWYYYDDNRGTKAEDRPQKAPDSAPSVINLPYGWKYRHHCGNMNDTFKMKDYKFLVKDEAGNKYCCMPFTLGTKWPCVGYMATPFVGIGTELAPDGKFIDLTGATSVKFKLRSHVNTIKVNFRIETMDVIRDSSFAFYYSQKIVAPGTWTSCEVVISTDDLAQPCWAIGDQVKDPFAQNMSARLSWEVNGESNAAVKSDTLDIDDVWIINYKYLAPSVWYKSETNRPACGLFSSFESSPKSATPLGTSWFAYDDHEDFGNSLITRGAAVDHSKGLFPLDWSEINTGFNDTGSGAAVQMKFGKTIKRVNTMGDTNEVQGFTGIGFTIYDSAKALYFNTTTGKLGTIGGTGSTESIYFEYMADGDYRYLTLEVRDSNDVPDKNASARKDKRGRGVAWYRNLPKTGPNIWRSVCIPFDSLIIHSDWKDFKKHISLDKTSLATIQFRAQGPEGAQGVIQVDNVYFPEIDFNMSDGTKSGIVHSGQQSAFRIYYRNGFIRVDGKSISDFTSGTIRIIDSKGVLLKSDRILSSPALSLDISTKRIPAGLYFLLASGVTADGKMIFRQAPLMILK